MFFIQIDLYTITMPIKAEMVGGMTTSRPNPWPILIQPLPKKVGGGNAVAQFVKALLYKQEGRGLPSLLGHWEFSLTKRLHYGRGVDSSSNRMSTRRISWV